METVISLRMDCLHWCTDDGIFDARNVCSGRWTDSVIDDHPPDPPICLILFIIIWKIITSSSLKWKPSENLLRSSHEVKIEDEAKPRPAFSPVLSLHPSIVIVNTNNKIKGKFDDISLCSSAELSRAPFTHSHHPFLLSFPSFPGLFFTFCSLPSSSPLISSPKKSPLWSNFFHSHHIFTSQFSKKVTFEPLCVCVGLHFVLLVSQQSFFQDPRSSDALPAEAISYGGFGSVFLE